ncbi:MULTISPECIES: hypothetical protein [Streptomyces]|nr:MULTISPECIES: hypothetical protein [Streptomyces]
MDDRVVDLPAVLHEEWATSARDRRSALPLPVLWPNRNREARVLR